MSVRGPGLEAELDARGDRPFVWLMFARLALALVSLGIAIGLEQLGRTLAEEARDGLFWTVALAFLATLVSGAMIGRMRHPLRFAAVQIAMDVAIAGCLVHFSGGRDSVFTFLFIIITVYAAVLFGRRAAVGAATLAAGLYGAVLFAEHSGLIASYGRRDPGSALPMLGAIWGLHVGALFLVGALASMLSRQLERAGAALRESAIDLQRVQHLHERTVESIMSGLMTLDLGGRITSFNPEAERISGVSQADAIGMQVEELIPGTWDVAQGAHSADGVPGRARLGYQTRAGAELALGLAASVLKEPDGLSVGFVVIFQDVTRVVAMEAELRQSERMAAVGEMAAKMAHEIRNPLASISGSIQILRSDLDETEFGEEPGRLMDIVVRETERLNGLITNFLQYARPGPTSLEEVELEPLLEEVLKVFDATRPPDVAVQVETSPGLRALADAGQLRQVIWNLLINAVQAMPDGGELSITTRKTEHATAQEVKVNGRNDETASASSESCTSLWVEIAVSDTGIGIPLEVQERMFEPFYTTKPNGSGLGLATVHRIIESNGGSLQLESEPGAGTCFRVSLRSGGASS